MRSGGQRVRAVTTNTITAPAVIAMGTYGDVRFNEFSPWSWFNRFS